MSPADRIVRIDQTEMDLALVPVRCLSQRSIAAIVQVNTMATSGELERHAASLEAGAEHRNMFSRSVRHPCPRMRSRTGVSAPGLRHQVNSGAKDRHSAMFRRPELRGPPAQAGRYGRASEGCGSCWGPAMRLKMRLPDSPMHRAP